MTGRSSAFISRVMVRKRQTDRQKVGVAHLIVVLDEGKVCGMQELSLWDVQAIFPVQELDDGAVAVPHRQVVLHHQALQVLDDTPDQ